MLHNQMLAMLLAAAGAVAQRGGGRGRPGPPPQQQQQQQPPATPTRIPMPGETQAVWGQCGGEEWIGTNVCERDTRCIRTNEWYSQCLPEEDIDEEGRPILDDPYVATSVLTTVIGNPTAVVTTFITILTPALPQQPSIGPPPQGPPPVAPITAVPDTPLNPR